jgi:hypothetical protein
MQSGVRRLDAAFTGFNPNAAVLVPQQTQPVVKKTVMRFSGDRLGIPDDFDFR